jgi:hypothetical protein
VDTWRRQFRFDPVPPLLATKDEALQYFVRRDLLGEQVGPVQRLWSLREPQKILKRQQADGSWPRPGEHEHPAINHALIETWRQFRFLVEQYGFTRESPAAARAAEFLFSCQTEEGDIRGILANQYMSYYMGAIMSLLVQAGYGDDPRMDKAFRWLLAMRQNDGAWSVPMVTYKLDRETQYRLSSEYAEPLQQDRSKPFSHTATGMILRAFAVHPQYRQTEEAQVAANLLKSRFFQPDAYTSYQAASYWVRFEYPFWWNNLVAALDSVSLIGLPREDEQIAQALQWLVDHQEPNGLWRVSYVQAPEDQHQSKKAPAMQLWITLAICRIFRRLYG